MQKNFKGYIFFFLTLAALLGSVFAAGFVFATGQTTSTLRGSGGASARPAIAPMVSTYTVNMRDVPAATTRSLSNPNKDRTLACRSKLDGLHPSQGASCTEQICSI